MTAQLVPGDAMPAIMAADADGQVVNMIDAVAGKWAVVQFYRGDW